MYSVYVCVNAPYQSCLSAAVSLHKRSLFNKPSALSFSVSPHTLISHSVLKHLTLPVHLCFIVFSCSPQFISPFLSLSLCPSLPKTPELLFCVCWAKAGWQYSSLTPYFSHSVIFQSLTCLLSKDEEILSLLAASNFPFLYFCSSLSVTPLMFIFLPYMLSNFLSLQIFLRWLSINCNTLGTSPEC